MHRLCACILLLISAGRASDNTAAILERTRQTVAAQLARDANYACVQTTDRQYFALDKALPNGCGSLSPTLKRVPLMRDRLRLDVAVSNSREIYSWHGEDKFTSSDVSQVVRTGPISSGTFTGFLHNIFLDRGAEFTYAGESERDGVRIYDFKFIMPLAHSSYHVQAKDSKPTVPFHGSFSINASNYQLTRLQVVADGIPSYVPMCSAETSIIYQLVAISGKPSLIPAAFVLQIDDVDHLHTISSSQYSQCREFRGESSIHFEFTDSPPEAAKQTKADEWLPGGMILRINLRTPIDDRTSYVGDPVEGVLLHDVKIPDTAKVVPKGAVLDGVITKLDDHYRPLNFQIFSVRFNRLRFGNTSFLLRASPKTSIDDGALLRGIYGSPLPPGVAEEYRSGLFVSLDSHFHFRRHSAQWITDSHLSVEPVTSTH